MMQMQSLLMTSRSSSCSGRKKNFVFVGGKRCQRNHHYHRTRVINEDASSSSSSSSSSSQQQQQQQQQQTTKIHVVINGDEREVIFRDRFSNDASNRCSRSSRFNIRSERTMRTSRDNQKACTAERQAAEFARALDEQTVEQLERTPTNEIRQEVQRA